METKEFFKKLKTCQSRQEFKELWNKYNKNINMKYCSAFLCSECTKFIEIWWDENNFNWEYCTTYLCRHCSKYFHIWWNSDKFDWEDIKYLEKYCLDYKHIWRKDYIKYKILKKGD